MDRFKAMREAAGMSAAELGERLGVTAEYVRAEEAKPDYNVDFWYAVNAPEACGFDSRAVMAELEAELLALRAEGKAIPY